MVQEKINIVSKIDMFEFFSVFFSQPRRYQTLTDKAKMEHSWMLYQLLSVYYPVSIQKFQNIHNVHLMDVLHISLGRPNALRFPKTDKMPKKADDVLKGLDASMLRTLMEKNNIEYKSLLIVAERFPAFIKAQLKVIDKMYEGKIKKKVLKPKKTKSTTK